VDEGTKARNREKRRHGGTRVEESERSRPKEAATEKGGMEKRTREKIVRTAREE